MDFGSIISFVVARSSFSLSNSVIEPEGTVLIWSSDRPATTSLMFVLVCFSHKWCVKYAQACGIYVRTALSLHVRGREHECV